MFLRFRFCYLIINTLLIHYYTFTISDTYSYTFEYISNTQHIKYLKNNIK